MLLNKMNTTVDGEFQRYSVESGEYIRDNFFGPDPRLREMVAHLTDDELRNLPRGGHDYRKLYAAYKAATENLGSGAPTVILAKTIKGWTLGEGFVFAMMAVGNINAPEIGQFGGLQFIILDVFGDTVGKIFLICVVIAVTVCCLAVHTATIRMAFAMARDNNLPAGERIATVHPKTKTPIVPAVISGVLAILILVVNIGNDQIFTVITSIGIIMIYMAYLLVTIPMLGKRFKGEWPPKETRFFTLGKWGLPINLLAVGWGIFMAVNLIWPRKDVYNASPPFHWYLQYGALLFIGIVFFGGLAYYWFVQRHKTGVLESHRFESTSPAVSEGALPESAP